MTVTAEATPNPNAMKFTVGRPVGGPASFTAANASEHPLAAELLDLEGVVSVFLTADFVTVTKAAEADWETITPAAVSAIETHYG